MYELVSIDKKNISEYNIMYGLQQVAQPHNRFCLNYSTLVLCKTTSVIRGYPRPVKLHQVWRSGIVNRDLQFLLALTARNS